MMGQGRPGDLDRFLDLADRPHVKLGESGSIRPECRVVIDSGRQEP
jgi:hypothetical protein